MSLLPGCRALPVSRAGGAGRTQAPCGLAPIPSSGDPTCSIGYPGQAGHMSCHLRGGRISARGPRGTGPPPDIRGHELFAAACVKVDLIGTSTLLRAEPYQSGSVLVAAGINAKPGIMSNRRFCRQTSVLSACVRAVPSFESGHAFRATSPAARGFARSFPA